MNASRSGNGSQDLDVLIVGAGFAGMYMLHRSRQAGLRAQVLEAGGGVGGTWYWNRYPGARCDIESVEYSYQFSHDLQQEWDWTERYAAQPEILRYAEHVADRFDLRRDIRFNTTVVSASFDEARARWVLETDAGDRLTAAFCIMATGCLSSTSVPDFKGLERFEGEWYHTGRWPHEEIDFSGRRVAVIGTGSSAIQSIPIIAEQAEQLFVFQRTPNYAVPARNAPLDPVERDRIKANYDALRALEKSSRNGTRFLINEVSALAVSPTERNETYQRLWDIGGLSFMTAFNDLLIDADANRTAAEFIAGKIREAVDDEQVAQRLTPDGVVGCKRLCVDTGYYETFNRDNVTLVDIGSAPIDEIVPDGIVVGDETCEVDAIVFATGFDAMTGALNRIDITGAGGRPLRQKWAEGPRTYLGIAVSGFPNLFTITGPGSPSVLTNMLPSIEHHVEFVADMIGYVRRQGCSSIVAHPEAEAQWVTHVNDVAEKTLYPSCNSWYLGENIPGKPRVFMPYLGYQQYLRKCRDVAAAGYDGFVLG